MNKKFVIRLAALLSAGAMSVSAVAFAEAPTAEPAIAELQTEAPETDARPAVDASVVATIGDIKINYDDVKDIYDYILEAYARSGYDADAENAKASIVDMAIDAAVMSKVQSSLETELGLDDFTEDERKEIRVKAKVTYDDIYNKLYANFNDGKASEDAIKAQVKSVMDTYGYSVDALTAQITETTVHERFQDYIDEGISVSDDDVRAYHVKMVQNDRAAYENNPAGYTTQAMYGSIPAYAPAGIRRVKHILIKYSDEDAQRINELMALSDRPADYETQLSALKQAAYASIKPRVDDIMARINAGEDFDALVKQFGEDPGMEANPEGYMLCAGAVNLAEEFVDAGMALEKIGDVTAEPALSGYGAHIMIYAGDVEPGEVKLDAERMETLRGKLTSDLREAAIDSAMDAQKAKLGEVYTYPENMLSAISEAATPED